MTTSATHTRLLDVAIDHFGRFGIDGASTRAIAKDADTPMSSITYHFGGKEGLYLATAAHIAHRMGQLLAPAIAKAAATCQSGCTPAQAREALHTIFKHAAAVLVSAETAPLARFIVREQANPTEAFNRIYDALMGPMLSRQAFLLGVISGGRLEESEARVRAIALMGQVLVFRVAREAALRAGGWQDVGTKELEVIQSTLADHLDAILDHLGGTKGVAT
jgi:TetR/AcrR family transcriptional regulator, regulator of cefoperazone and chloramphenicol sensitivity